MEGRRWEEMEEDCLVNIFRRLSLVDLTVAAPSVCRSWRKASLDPLCWRVLDFRGMDFMPWSDLCKSLAARLSVRRPSFTGLLKLAATRSKGTARELRFPRVFGASLRDLVYASDAYALLFFFFFFFFCCCLPRIKSLCLHDSYLPKEKLLAILSGSRELEKLSVTDCIGFEADEEILHKASGLEAFEYEGSKLADDLGYETDECDPLYVHVV